MSSDSGKFLRNTSVSVAQTHSPVAVCGARNKEAQITWDVKTLTTVVEMQHEMHLVLNELMAKVASVQRIQAESSSSGQTRNTSERVSSILLFREWILVALVLVFQMLLQWFFFH